MNAYRCPACGKTVLRKSSKQWIKSLCEATGRDVRIWKKND
jgi:ribosomal protein L37AE/L43A